MWKSYKEAAVETYGTEVKVVADLFHVVCQGTWAFNRARRNYIKSKETKIKVGITWKSLTYSKSKLDPIQRVLLDYRLLSHPVLKVNY